MGERIACIHRKPAHLRRAASPSRAQPGGIACGRKRGRLMSIVVPIDSTRFRQTTIATRQRQLLILTGCSAPSRLVVSPQPRLVGDISYLRTWRAGPTWDRDRPTVARRWLPSPTMPRASSWRRWRMALKARRARARAGLSTTLELGQYTSHEFRHLLEDSGIVQS